MGNFRHPLNRGFTLIELLVTIAIISVLGSLLATAGWKAYEESSLAISANNLRQLSVGGVNYLAEHNNVFWRYRDVAPAGQSGTTWWFGFQSSDGPQIEGQRILDTQQGPLAGYVPAAIKPDPSFKLGGYAFKPKFQFGYIGIGYNVLLGGGWNPPSYGANQTLTNPCANRMALSDMGKVVVFATSAQVNTFQAPASSKNPMVEEFYGLDEKEVTVHFRHHGYAMVTYADGSAGFLPRDPATRDTRMPKANVGRFAPVNNTLYLQ